MYTMSELGKLRVFVPRKPSRKDLREGTEPDPKRLGKVHSLVFSPNGRTVVGFMVKRPDIAGMVKQQDRFLALDAIERREGGLLCTRPDDGFDAAACRRLGLDLDRCYVWEGMNVRTESGKFLGYVMDARFDERTGAVDCFCAQEGGAASALVGTFEIPAAWLVGYRDDTMVVRDDAAGLQLSGGLAGKAGEGYAAAKEGAKKAVAKADDAASKAVDKGSRALGGLIGRAKAGVGKMVADASGREASGEQAAKGAEPVARAVGEQLGKTKGMFSGFLKEFNDASK